MKRIIIILTMIALILPGCAGAVPSSAETQSGDSATWQDQYDLGVRYLSEGNYKEAILAFTAAIEIDEKQAPAYVGRGKAFVLAVQAEDTTEDNFASAQADFERAIELDALLEDAYTELAELYITKQEYSKAIEVLESGIEATGSDELRQRLKDVEALQEPFRTSSYIEFDTLEPTVQTLIRNLVEKTETGNRESVYPILTGELLDMVSAGTIPNILRTKCDGWKVQLIRTIDGNTQADMGGIEIRQENGAAYSCLAMLVSGQYVGQMTVGSTENWNWNGQFKIFGNYYTYNGQPYVEVIGSGSCVNSLLDGTFIYQFPNGEGDDSTETYSLGKRIDENSGWDFLVTIDGAVDEGDYLSMLW